MDEPIVDPALPRRDRWRAVGALAVLLGSPDPEPPRWTRVLFAAGAGVTGVSGALFAVAAFQTDHESAGLAAVMVFLVTVLFIGVARPAASRRPAGRYAGRYVIPSELDTIGLDLLARARRAIQDVTASRVNRGGLLDEVANDVVLRQRLWEVARLVRMQAELRAEQADALAEVMTPELAAVLEPQQEALGRSVAAVTEWVWELEVYAGRVRAADSALRACELQRSDDRYRDLLAESGDAEGLRALSDQADALTRMLREAIAAGQTLADEIATD
ncbi:hypothetical protein [Nonomuraea sp. NPDC002799]